MFRVLLAISYRSIVPVFVMSISIWFNLLDSWFLEMVLCVKICTARFFLWFVLQSIRFVMEMSYGKSKTIMQEWSSKLTWWVLLL
jgi:hypothetical protein